MYHEIPADGNVPYFGVHRERFAAHLDAMRQRGIAVVSLEAALAPGKSTGRFAAITFDDGHVTHFTEAFPLLAQRGQTATFFVVSQWVGRKDFATWGQLREMADAGMSIQSHTASHPFLSELDAASVRRELSASRQEIEQRLGIPCRTIALPNGDAPRSWSHADYASCGYDCVATSRFGPNAPTNDEGVRVIRRYTIRRETTTAAMERRAMAAESAWSPEGLRLSVLNTVRSTIGATRYARMRRAMLQVIRPS